MRDLQSEGN